MRKVFEMCSDALSVTRYYPTSFFGGIRNRKLFNVVKTCCVFIGTQGSGKTLIASLLDAHPNMIFADDLDLLRYVYAGYGKRQIYYLLLENSRLFSKTGRNSKGFSYKVLNQWQGRYEKLHVIGDNNGVAFLHRFKNRPWLFQKLQKVIAGQIKFIHLIRNPFDNISTIFMEKKRYRCSLELMESIEYYFSLCTTVLDIKKKTKRIRYIRYQV